MIRFYDRTLLNEDDTDFIIASKEILFDENIWQSGKEYFKHNLSSRDTETIQMLPVTDRNKELLCYAWQDNEANRELRMLRELEDALESGDVLQFRELYREIQEVIVHGCNEFLMGIPTS